MFLRASSNRLLHKIKSKNFIIHLNDCIGSGEKETGGILIHPFDDIDVIAGQGTIALEILEQKVQEGVEVRVICDGVGTYMLTGKAYQRYLHSKGIKSKVFNPLRIFFYVVCNN